MTITKAIDFVDPAMAIFEKGFSVHLANLRHSPPRQVGAPPDQGDRDIAARAMVVRNCSEVTAVRAEVVHN